jgi:elongation factor 3
VCCGALCAEFVTASCPEIWKVGGGRCEISGATTAARASEKVEFKVEEDMVDAFGNIVKIKQPKKKLTNKEKKKLQKAREARRARGEEVSDTDEDE